MPQRPVKEEVRGVIAALLVSRKHTSGIHIAELDQDYRQQEGCRIPFRELGYSTLIDYLQSLKDTVFISQRNGTYYVSPIVTEKIQHVSSLVSGQKQSTRKCSRGGRRIVSRDPWYRPKMDRNTLADIVGLIRDTPNGVHVARIIKYIFQKTNVEFGRQDVASQLREVSHEIFMEGDVYYPITRSRNRVWSAQTTKSNSTNVETRYSNNETCYQSRNSNSRGTSSANNWNTNIRPAGCSDSEEEDMEYVSCMPETSVLDKPANVDSNKKAGSLEIDNKNRDSETKDAKSGESASKLIDDCDNSNNHNCNNNNNNNNNSEEQDNEKKDDIALLINEKTLFRLEKLIQNAPDGIWCAELPALYKKEYGISLNYQELGFDSVIDFVSYVPNIFQIVQPEEMGDHKLFNAKIDMSEIAQKARPQTLTLAALHSMHEIERIEALPSVVPKELAQQFIPDGVMTLNETVGQISVTQFAPGDDQYVEVIVVEVFTPSFFWIQLRKKIPKFEEFMNDLHQFYEDNASKYVVLRSMLEKGLNCACLYDDIWHRGVIKSVKPDYKVTVLFYDYGTVTTNPPDSIHYLHRTFSRLPAQAIPCGLYEVKPISGNQWTKKVTYAFLEQVSQVPLMATIGSTDIENNSMLIGLTNTEDKEDFHINSWMIEKGFAKIGKMVCTRPSNYQFRRFLECEYLKNFNRNEDTSNDSMNIKLDDNIDDRRSSSSSKYSSDQKIAFHHKLLKLHRSPEPEKNFSQKNPDISNSRSNIERNCVLNSIKSKTEESKTTNVAINNILYTSKLNNCNFKDDKTTISRGNKFGLRVRKISTKNLAEISSDSSSLESNEPPRKFRTKKVNYDDEKIEDFQGQKIPLHLKNLRVQDNINEFGSFHSPSGGNGRMEPVDWEQIRGTVKNIEKIGEKSTNKEFPVEILESSIPKSTDAVSKTSRFRAGKQSFWNFMQEKRTQENLEFGTSRSSSSGNDRMEPVDWNNVRDAVQRPITVGKVSETKQTIGKKSSEILTKEFPMANKPFLNLIKNKLAPETDYPDSLFVPEGNIKTRVGVSPTVRALMNTLYESNETRLKISISKEILEILNNDDSDCDSREIKTNSATLGASKIEKTIDENNSNETKKPEIVKTKRVNTILNYCRNLKFNLENGIKATSSMSGNSVESNLSEETSKFTSSEEIAASLEKSISQEKIDSAKIANNWIEEKINSAKIANNSSKEKIDSPKIVNNSNEEKIDFAKIANNSSEEKIDSSKTGNNSNEEKIDSAKTGNNVIEETNVLIQSAFLKPNKIQLTKLSKLAESCLNSTIDSVLDSDDFSFAHDQSFKEEEKLQLQNSTTNISQELDSDAVNFDVAMVVEKKVQNSENSDLIKESADFDSVTEKTDENPEISEQFADAEEPEQLIITEESRLQVSIKYPDNIPVFDDLNVESDTDEWDYSPGRFVIPTWNEKNLDFNSDDFSDENSDFELSETKFPKATKCAEICWKSSETNVANEKNLTTNLKENSSGDYESSLEISFNIDQPGTSGSSRQETDTDNQTLNDNKFSIKNVFEKKVDSPVEPRGRSKSLQKIINRIQAKKLLESGERCNSNNEIYQDSFDTNVHQKNNSNILTHPNYSILNEIKKSKISAMNTSSRISTAILLGRNQSTPIKRDQ